MLIFSIIALRPLTIHVSLCFRGALITVNYINHRYLSTDSCFTGCTINGNIQINVHDTKKLTSSNVCRPTQCSTLVCRKMFVLLGNSPVPVQLNNFLCWRSQIND